MLKSATISFGENLVPEDLDRAQRAAGGADVFLALGTSLGVYPAAALPEIALAQRRPPRDRATPRRRRSTRYADAVIRDPLGERAPRARRPGLTPGSRPVGNIRPLR